MLRLLRPSKEPPPFRSRTPWSGGRGIHSRLGHLGLGPNKQGNQPCPADLEALHGDIPGCQGLFYTEPDLTLKSNEHIWGFPGGTVIKNLLASAGDARDVGSIPGSGRSPGEGHGNPLQCSRLENPMDRGAWWATVHRFEKRWTQLK